MQSSPSTVCGQSADKQRIVTVGKTNSRIVQMILHVLNQYDRKFDYSTPDKEKISDSPIIIIEPAYGSNSVSEYKHHILILSQLSADDKDVFLKLAYATPRSGTIIYDETNQWAKEIAKTERADVFLSPFTLPKHEISNGKVTLISSTNEKFPIPLTSTEDLKNISAAKELLKKIGISSGQFYNAIASFQ